MTPAAASRPTPSWCWRPAPRPAGSRWPTTAVRRWPTCAPSTTPTGSSAALTAGGRVVIIGGGWIGLEVASAAARGRRGSPYSRPCELPLVRVLGPEVGRGLRRPPPRARRRPAPRTAVDASRPTATVASTLGDGSTVDGRPARRRRRRRARRRRSPRRAGLDVDNGVLVDAPCAPPTPTSSPSATSPTRTTRSSGADRGSSTGTPRSSRARPPRATCSGEDESLRRAAVLLHRPVRLRPGVRRQPRPRGVRRGGAPGRRRRAASWPGGCATATWSAGDARQRLGRDRRDPGAGRLGRRRGPAGRPGNRAGRARRDHVTNGADRGGRRRPAHGRVGLPSEAQGPHHLETAEVVGVAAGVGVTGLRAKRYDDPCTASSPRKRSRSRRTPGPDAAVRGGVAGWVCQRPVLGL